MAPTQRQCLETGCIRVCGCQFTTPPPPPPPQRTTEMTVKIMQNFISIRDGPVKEVQKQGRDESTSTKTPVKSTETRQKNETTQAIKHARRLHYYGTMLKRKDKKTTLHLLYIFCRCRVVVLYCFLAVVPYSRVVIFLAILLLVCFHLCLVFVLFYRSIPT